MHRVRKGNQLVCGTFDGLLDLVTHAFSFSTLVAHQDSTVLRELFDEFALITRRYLLAARSWSGA